MAASNSKSTSLGNGYTLTASFSQGERYTDSNYSKVTCTATLSSGGTRWESGYNSYIRIYWHDNRENYDRFVAEYALSSCAYWSSYSASGTINVTHKDDGTLSGYAYATFTKGGTSAYAPNTGGVATDLTALWSIARASTPSISPSSTFNIGDTITINTNRASTSFTHTLSLSFGSYSYQIATDVTDSTTLDTSTIANNLYQEIPNAAQGTGTLTCVTYSGSTTIGTKTLSFTAKVVNSNPTFDQAYQDINPTTIAITDDSTYIIRNQSHLQIYVTNTSAKNYATLASLKAVIEGVEYVGDLRGTGGSIETGTLNIASDTVAQVILTDSRGISTTKNLSIKILNWELPTAIISLGRQNNFYSETDIKVDANYSYLTVDNINKNTITIKVRSKKTTDQSYGAYTTLQDNVTTTLTLDNNYQWDVQVLLQDRLGSTTYNLAIDRGIPIIFFDRLRRSVGVDCFPQYDSSFEVNGVDRSNIYSTTERPIGIWIDGSIIYRKVVDMGTSSSGNISVNHDISNLDKVINVYGIASNNYNNNITQYSIPKVSNSSYNNQIGIDVTATQITLINGSSVSFNVGSFVVIEYTKSA